MMIVRQNYISCVFGLYWIQRVF